MYQKKRLVSAHPILIPIWNLPNKVSVGILNKRNHSDHRGRQVCHFPKKTFTMNNQHHLHHHQQQRQYCYNGQQHTNQRFGGGGGGGGSNRPYNPYASAQKQRRLFQEGMVSAFANKSITMVNVYLTKRLFGWHLKQPGHPHQARYPMVSWFW